MFDFKQVNFDWASKSDQIFIVCRKSTKYDWLDLVIV